MKTCILLLLTILVISCSSVENKCTITGGIIGRKTNTLLLFKASKFPVYEAEIPITNNSFTYSFNFRQPEVYLLILKDEFKKGSMRETPFFAEAGKIRFTINSDKDLKGSEVKGHQLNDAMIEYYRVLKDKFFDLALKYKDSVNAMYRNGTVFTKDFQALQDAARKTNDPAAREQLMSEERVLKSAGLMYNPKAQKFIQKQDSILNKERLWEFEYIDKNTSLLSLYLFMNRMKEISTDNGWKAVDDALVKRVQANIDRYTRAFPEHPYGLIVKNTLDGLSNIHFGGKMIDFNASDVKGDSLSLSGCIKGNKLTLLNFWSTWSASTIKTNKEMIPVYKEFKDKGFEIVGITQGFGKTDELVSFIQKANYPWKNLIDKDNKSGVWEKYNLSYQSGGTFLINSSGVILAINPTADDVKVELARLLK